MIHIPPRVKSPIVKKLRSAVIAALLSVGTLQAQTATSPIQGGSSVYNGYLYHNGNVGIGSANPGGFLHIHQDWIVGAPYNLSGNFLQVDKTEKVGGTFLNPILETYSYLVVTSQGQVGIGTATPSSGYKLHVVGDVGISGNSAISGNATVGGTANISGNTTIGGTASITGNTTIGGTLTISNNFRLNN